MSTTADGSARDCTVAGEKSAARPGIVNQPHDFFIPVMGTGFTIDTPLRVARYGITSVVSIGDDILVEQVRKHYCDCLDIDYVPIGAAEDDSRARRIQAYLDFLHDRVQLQTERVRSEAFTSGSDITRYFEMLPPGPLRKMYESMLRCADPAARAELQELLRRNVIAGKIDVNIMTKVDREQVRKDGRWIPESGLAMTALRGFATSKLQSDIVLSAGINKRLFAYMATFNDFLPEGDAPPKKGIILKVSDYRSAHLQGRLLAKHGLWVSEYRIESGLNCGGHAFATKGQLMGPVLEEFRRKRASLVSELAGCCHTALKKRGRTPATHPNVRLSAQGGVGTHDEHRFLREHYGIERVGWGTPFLFVPQATNLDVDHIRRLLAAGEDDIVLSDASPLGVPFWILRTTASERKRRRRIADGTPGRRCTKRFLATDTEFPGAPVCKASKQYQAMKLQQLDNGSLTDVQRHAARSSVLAKTCLCMDLAAGVMNRLNIGPQLPTSICCGKSAIDFNGIYRLEEMVNHIYGRSRIRLRSGRPNMFARELSLYIDYLGAQLTKSRLELETFSSRYFGDFVEGLQRGIEYYRELLSHFNISEAAQGLPSLSDLEERAYCLLQTVAAKPVLGAGASVA